MVFRILPIGLSEPRLLLFLKGYKMARPTRVKLREFHFINQNGICAYCGDRMNSREGSPKQVTLEHVIPCTFGGRNIIGDTIATCAECNEKRGHSHLQYHQMVGILIAKGIDGVYLIVDDYFRILINKFSYSFSNSFLYKLSFQI
jgi:hypothetical protein